MIFTHRIALGGVWLDELDERIVIGGIRESTPRETLNSVSLLGGQGSRLTARHRDSLDVTVVFRLDIRKDDMEARELLLEKIRGWAAAGGNMRLNYRPDRILRVICAENAEGGDPWEWTRDYTIVFRAMGIPCWQTESYVSIASGTTTSGTVTVPVPGNMMTVGDVTIRNVSGAEINTVTVQFGSSRMSFSSLGMAAGESLVIDHSEDGLLRIRLRTAGGSYRSAMAKRGAESADDLYINPGNQSAVFTAQRACIMTASCRGRFI